MKKFDDLLAAYITENDLSYYGKDYPLSINNWIKTRDGYCVSVSDPDTNSYYKQDINIDTEDLLVWVWQK